jgi:hypothetical protein
LISLISKGSGIGYSFYFSITFLVTPFFRAAFVGDSLEVVDCLQIPKTFLGDYKVIDFLGELFLPD